MLQPSRPCARPRGGGDGRPGEGTALKALEKTLRILDLFDESRPEWGLLELSEAAGLPVSTLHRIVSVLRRHGLVTQDPLSKRYRLGYGAIDLGRRAASGLTIRHVATPFMRRLAEQTGETIVLTALNDQRDRAVCIERIESRHDLRLHLEVGGQSYLHAGASSKVLLAWFGQAEVEDLVRRVGLPLLAPNTIQDLSRLLEELSVIRSQGYAFSREETNSGAWGVAVPILDSDDRAIAGIGIAAPTSRHSDDAERRFIALTLEAGNQLAEALGLVRRP